MSPLRVLGRPEQVGAAIAEGVRWCDEFSLCTPAIDSSLERAKMWRALLEGERKLRRAYVALDGMRSEPHALARLHHLGALRLVPAADGSFRSHVYVFRRGDELRVLMGAGSCEPEGFMAPLVTLISWQGGRSTPFAIEVERLMSRAAAFAYVPTRAELAAYDDRYFAGQTHRDALASLGAPLVRRPTEEESTDLELVTEASAVRANMSAMKRALADAATLRRREVVGFPGGNVSKVVHWSAALGLWFFSTPLDNRYWNCFGTERPGSSRSLAITVEVNPPRAGQDRKMAGAFACDRASGRTFLVHRGRIGGGQRGVGPELFWSRFRGGVSMREDGRTEPARVAIVGEIGAPSFARDVSVFVHEVARIKRAA